jgi:hypothetical protein
LGTFYVLVHGIKRNSLQKKIGRPAARDVELQSSIGVANQDDNSVELSDKLIFNFFLKSEGKFIR